MKINLHEKIDIADVNTGDILVFSNCLNYDYYLVVRSNVEMDCRHQIISMSSSVIEYKWKSLSDMMDELTSEIENGYKLIEIIKKGDLVLSRATNV